MASDNRAHYSKIGFAVLIAAAATVATLIWLGGLGEGEDPLYLETYYERSVSGLSVGSPVNFRGVTIGKVAVIDFVGNHYDVVGKDNSRIYIKLAIDRKALGMAEDEGYDPESLLAKLVEVVGLRATVTASGITGLSRIECDYFPDAPPPQKLSWTPRSVYIPPKMSLLEDFSSAATRVMNQINAMDFAAVWSNISVTVEQVSESTRSARTMLDAHRSEIGEIVDSAAEAVSSLKDFAAELKRNPSALVRDRRVEPLDETR